MTVTPLNQLSACAIADGVARGTFSAEEVVRACLDRIEKRDRQVKAWAWIDPEHALAQARMLDKKPEKGPLAGVPIGIKDIIETFDMPTDMGSPIYRGNRTFADAPSVALARRAGAVILGKTVTCEFAGLTPNVTRNPHDLDRTPGGSSSGSAAAVGDFMAAAGYGTQTGGSVLRPASFCGVTGFKPTYGLLPMEGVLPLSKSLDTLGFFTHTPADMSALWDSLGHSMGTSEDFDLGVPEPIPDVEPTMAAAYKNALSRLRKAGTSIRPIDIAGTLAKLAEANLTVMLYEGARFHKQRYDQYGNQLADLADLIRQGLQISVDRYDETLRYIDSCRVQFAEQFKRTPVILTPAAMGPAPTGLASTGDPRMNAPWTALGTPAVSIPMPVGTALPLGLQLTAERGGEARVLRTAVRLQNMLGSQPI